PVIECLPTDLEFTALEVAEGLDFETTAATIGARGGHATYVGYSMGGRLCLMLALDRPDLVERLVLVSASPGIADAGARDARRSQDERLALEIEREGVGPFLERWLAQPLFASLPRELAQLDERRRNSPTRLTHQLRVLGQGVQPSLWDRLGELRMPVTLVTGAYDKAYSDIARRMAQRIGERATLVTIPGAGHAAPLEQPAAVAHAIVSA
ncbi:MAG TPA: alpha/beta fold hydrolase, partial [Acidimicrobiia bacterium]|nr:alpha/beta fold hydrolase [Acidimicrobiia bacterium]